MNKKILYLSIIVAVLVLMQGAIVHADNINIVAVDIDVEGEDDFSENDISQGDEIDVFEGDVVTITLELENNFSSSSGVILEHFEVDIEDDEDWNINLDEDDERDNDEIDELEAGDTQRLHFEFTVPEFPIDENTEITIEVKAEDNTSQENTHEAEFSFNLEADIPAHKVIFTDITVNPESVCEESIQVQATFENKGTQDQDELLIMLSKPLDGLTPSLQKFPIGVDSGDQNTVSFEFAPSQSLFPGDHLGSLYIYRDYSQDDLLDVVSFSFTTTNDCIGQEESEDEEEQEESPQEESEDNNQEEQPPMSVPQDSVPQGPLHDEPRLESYTDAPVSSTDKQSSVWKRFTTWLYNIFH